MLLCQKNYPKVSLRLAQNNQQGVYKMGSDDIFIGGMFGSRHLGHHIEVEMSKAEVLKYFPNCPICGSGRIKVNIVMGGKDTVTCFNCGSRWHIYLGVAFGDLKWAKLELEADDGRGKELLGKEIEASEWQEMAKESRRKLRNQNQK